MPDTRELMILALGLLTNDQKAELEECPYEHETDLLDRYQIGIYIGCGSAVHYLRIDGGPEPVVAILIESGYHIVKVAYDNYLVLKKPTDVSLYRATAVYAPPHIMEKLNDLHPGPVPTHDVLSSLFVWNCPSSPSGKCEYRRPDGTLDEDDCIYCHQPDERK